MNYLQKKKQAIIMMLAAQIIKTAQGYPVAINDCESGTAVDYTVYGNSVQDGTPTPESPVEIQSVGDLTKNLLPNDWESGFISVSSGANQNSLTYVRTKDYFTFDIAKNYYISSDSIDTSATIIWYFYDENKNFISRFVSYKNRTIGTSGCQVTIPTNTVFFRLAVLTTDVNIKVQIEEGTTATEYEPYGYKIPIVNSSKNLLPYPYNESTKTVNGITFTDNGDGSVTVSGTATEYVAFNFVQALPCRPNQAYTIVKNGVDVNNVSFVFCDVNENGKITREIVSTTREKTFTVTTLASTAYIKLLMKRQNNAKCTGTVKPTLELGTTATEYEPYRVPVTANIYLDEPLKKGESINFGADNLPGLQLFEGSNVITAGTVVKPEKISVDYYEKG